MATRPDQTQHLCRIVARLFLFCAISLIAPLESSAGPITVPTDLNVGDKYRLAFVTSTVRDGTSSNIADYNAFVTGVATGVPELAALGTTWTAIASTATVAARDNTGTNPTVTAGVPIYRLDDIRIADDNADLWDGLIDVPLTIYETGTFDNQVVRVWTGTHWQGEIDAPLGVGTPRSGSHNITDGRWVRDTLQISTDLLRLYAISGELTVVPEPSTLLLAGCGAVGACLAAMRRMRRARLMGLMMTFLVMVALAAPCRASLTHHYPFSLDASDAVGAADGTLIGGASVSGGALHLDGVDDYVEFGEKIVPTSGSYTVALFARQSTPQLEIIELISQGFTFAPGFYLGHDASGIIRATDSWLSTGVSFPADGQYHHYALTVDAGAGRSDLYVDGDAVAMVAFAIATTSGGSNTRLGRQFDPYLEFFAGEIDDVRIYSSALAPEDVAALAAVPEPSALTLAACGALGVAISCLRQ